MPAVCSVCALEARSQVDESLVAGDPYRDIAKRHDVSISALSRHRRGHLSPALAAVQAAKVTAGGMTTAERVEGLYGRAEKILESVETSGQASLALASIRELRSLVELLARLSGELDERPQVNVINLQSSPDWVELRGLILSALAPYPAAFAAVTRALSPAAPKLYEPPALVLPSSTSCGSNCGARSSRLSSPAGLRCWSTGTVSRSPSATWSAACRW